MSAKFLSALLAWAVDGKESQNCGTESTAMLQRNNFSEHREAIAQRRAELLEVRGRTELGAVTEAVNIKLQVMDGALAYEDSISKLKSVESRLHDGSYEAFPAGDAVTAVAEETLAEEIKHQQAGEALVLRLEEQPANIDRGLLKMLVEEWLTDQDFDASALWKVRLPTEVNVSTQPDGDALFGARASDGFRDHRWAFEYLEAKLAKAHGGRYKFLDRFKELKSIVEESMEEELHHQKLHEILLQKLEAIPAAASLRERVAKNAVLTVLNSDVPNATEVADGGPPDGDDDYDRLYTGGEMVDRLYTV